MKQRCTKIAIAQAQIVKRRNSSADITQNFILIPIQCEDAHFESSKPSVIRILKIMRLGASYKIGIK